MYGVLTDSILTGSANPINTLHEEARAVNRPMLSDRLRVHQTVIMIFNVCTKRKIVRRSSLKLTLGDVA